MIELTYPSREIAILFEVLRHGYPVGTDLSEVVDKVPALSPVRSSSSHERVPRWSAERKLTVGSVKDQRSVGQRIDVRCVHVALSIGSQLRAQVIHHDVENVLALRSSDVPERGKRQQEDEDRPRSHYQALPFTFQNDRKKETERQRKANVLRFLIVGGYFRLRCAALT